MIRYTSARQISLEGFAPFCDKLDETNRWIELGRKLPWDEMAGIYYRALSTGMGRPALDARLVIGAMIIKHKLGLSDEGTVQMIGENPYQQWFCGLSAFSTKEVFDPSLFVSLRQRMGGDVFLGMNQAILDLAQGHTKAKKEEKEEGTKGKPKPPERNSEQDKDQAPPTLTHKGVLKIDATVAPQKIAFPTDLNLLNKAREHSEAMIDALSAHLFLKKKPRTYRKLARKNYLSVVRKKKKPFKVVRNAIKRQLQYLRRNLSTIHRLWDAAGMPWPLDFGMVHRLWVIQEVYRQQQHMYSERVRRVDHRIVSTHQPQVRPIVRGKAGANVEFGAKLNVALCDGVAWLDHLSWDAHNESEWLIYHVQCYKQRYGYYPEAVNVDGIYGTRDNRTKLKDLGIRFIGKALGRPSAESLTAEAKRELKREMGERNHIEGKFGQGKNAYGLGCIPARRKDTSESWIHAIFFVMNLITLLPQLPNPMGSCHAFLLRLLRQVQHTLSTYTLCRSLHHGVSKRYWEIRTVISHSTRRSQLAA